MKKKILVILPLSEDHKRYLESIAPDCEFTYVDLHQVTAEQVREANVLFGNAPRDMVQQAEDLEWFQLNSAGFDFYSNPSVIPEGTVVTSATGAYGLAVSEGMLAMTMILCRKMDLYMRSQVNHLWQAKGKINSVWNSTTLVLGLGDIGTEYARRMKALGSYVIGVRRHPGEKPDCVDELHTIDELDELLPRADFVSMVLPGNAASYHLMDERRLRLMKPTAYLINAGRGNAVDCDALARILQEGTIGGSALDVTDPEPLPADHPLWDAPRSIIFPHIAGNFFLSETFERLIRIMGENLAHYAAGEPEKMRNIVKP